MVEGAEGAEGKKLSLAQGVEAARILFEINTDPAQVLHLAREAGLPPCADQDAERLLCLQWYGFVHAAVVAALMVHAPSVAVAHYLRGTAAMLAARGLPPESCDNFIDTVFSPYMELLAQEKPGQCPALFFRHVCRTERLEDTPPRTVAMISGAMALVISATNDKLEQYVIGAE